MKMRKVQAENTTRRTGGAALDLPLGNETPTAGDMPVALCYTDQTVGGERRQQGACVTNDVR